MVANPQNGNDFALTNEYFAQCFVKTQCDEASCLNQALKHFQKDIEMPKYNVSACEISKNENSDTSKDESLVWWVYGEGKRFGPFTRSRAEELAANLNSKGIASDKNPQRSGKIISIEGGLVIQNVGCDNIILHDASELPKPLYINTPVKITYKDGFGTVTENNKIREEVKR